MDKFAVIIGLAILSIALVALGIKLSYKEEINIKKRLKEEEDRRTLEVGYRVRL